MRIGATDRERENIEVERERKRETARAFIAKGENERERESASEMEREADEQKKRREEKDIHVCTCVRVRACVCTWRTLLRFLPTTMTEAIKAVATITTRDYSRCVISCTMTRSVARVTVMVPAAVWPSDIRVGAAVSRTESLVVDRGNAHRNRRVGTIARSLRKTDREREKRYVHARAASTTRDYITRRTAARRARTCVRDI